MSRRLKYPWVSRKALLLNSSYGFTLLELMVSLIIIAMIAGILFSALRLGIRAVHSGERRIDAIERFGSSVNIINSQIQSLNPLTFDEDGEERYFFEGDSVSLQFSSNYSVWGGQKGYVLVSYRIEEDDSGKQVLAVSENVIGIESIRETRLLDSLDRAGFEYFYRDPLEESGEWIESWSDTLSIPGKVRLTFVYGNEEFSITIPVRVTGSLSGAYPAAGALAPMLGGER